jgi:hypothetical protein
MINDLQIFVINEKDIPESLDAAIRKGLVECFPPDVEYFSKQSWWHSRPQWRTLALKEKRIIVGHIAVVVRNVLVGDKSLPVKVAGIQSVFVCPELQGSGLSDKLMKLTMQTAYEKRIDFGFLFCIPRFEKTYHRMGWQKINTNVFMQDHKGNTLSIPGKNIAMIYPLERNDFPAGDVNLAGPDW